MAVQQNKKNQIKSSKKMLLALLIVGLIATILKEPIFYIVLAFLLLILILSLLCSKKSARQENTQITTSADITSPDIQTIYFKDGHLFKIEGKDESDWYDADFLVSDGVRYDLSNSKDIERIKIPDFGITDTLSGYGTTGMLDYVLRMKSGRCFNKGEKLLCSALLWKSTEMMFANKYCNWRTQDFKRLIDWHLQLDMPEEAERARQYLDNNGISFVSAIEFSDTSKNGTRKKSLPKKDKYPAYEKKYVEKAIANQKKTFDGLAKSIKTSVLSNSKRFNCDLVVFHDYGSGCCDECSMQTGRVYSISGSHKYFPPLPDYVKRHGNFHPGCRCTMSAYFDDGTIYYKGKQVNAIKASQRPWCDDRTETEKQQYDEYINRITSEAKSEASKEWDRNEYDALLSELPNDAPKSFSSYRRMKYANTTGFQKLQVKAAEKGIII